MIRCPHCNTRVAPTAEGACPACRKNTRQQPAEVPENDRGGTTRAAWDAYQESLRPTSVERLVTFLRQVEQPFTDVRTGADACLRSNACSDSAAADRIRQELLPHFVTAVEQLQQAHQDSHTARLLEYSETRQESWRALAEALSEHDSAKLERHLELWEKSEMLTLSIVGQKALSATPTPAQRVQDFQRALVTFTPRLIATPAIVLANILVFAAMIAAGANFFEPTVQIVREWGANFGPKTANGQWWRLVSCMFLHFGILHLGFNMWILWDLGRVVERLVGNVGFVVLYFVSGIAGSMASLTWNPLVVSAGASGAVFGVVGALLGLIAFRRDTIPAPVLKHLWKSMAAFLVYNMVFGMMVPGIDLAAHIGGLIAGFLCGLMLSQPLSVEMVVRRQFRNAAVAAAGAIALPLWALALPNIPSAVLPPSCTSADVAKLLEQVIRGTPIGSTLKSIDGYRELSYDSDANVRHGECVAHTASGDQRVNFVVEWRDPDKGLFQVQTMPADLPSCTSPEVVKLLEQVIRDTAIGSRLKSVDGHRELSYDREANVRHGECVAHTETGDQLLKFVVQWEDLDQGMFQVRFFPADLPSCTDPEVVEILEQVIRSSPGGGTLRFVDGHRELSYDRDADVRRGECVAHTDDGEIPVQFIVQWQDREKGVFQVQTVAAQN